MQARSASRAWMVAVSVVALASSCMPERDRSGPPSLEVDPSSAMQGASLVVTLSAEGISLDECSDLAPSSLTFRNLEGVSQVTVYTLEPFEGNALRGQIAVADDASPGEHSVSLACDSATTLEGVFSVRQRAEEPALSFDPAQGPAGSVDLGIDVHAPGAGFGEGASHVIFGDGTQVVIVEQVVVGREDIHVVVDISPLTPAGDMPVAVVTGDEVARGTFAVTDRIWPTIQVDPTEAERGSPGAPTQASLTIDGTGVHFVEPAADAGADDPDATHVAFPNNHGITVTAVNVASPTRLLVNILLNDIADLGPTTLRVSTSDQIAETDFTVLPHPGTATLTLSPASLPRGAENALVLAEATNFDFTEPVTAAFQKPGCQVVSSQILNEKAIALYVSVDPGFDGDENVVDVTSGGQSVSSYMEVTTEGGFRLANPVPAALSQGEMGKVVAIDALGGTLDPGATARVLARSGIRVASALVDDGGGAIRLWLDVANDAPVGPALIEVDSAGTLLRAFLSIEAVGPFVSVPPSVMLPGRRTVEFVVSASGMTLSQDVDIAFDDPAIEVTQLAPDGLGGVNVTAVVGPAARSDMTTVYVREGASSAAATFLVLAASRPTATALPLEVERGDRIATSVAVTGEGTSFLAGDTVARLPDGIGVDVTHVEVQDAATLVLDLSVDEDGPGGWTGILVRTGDEAVVVPLHVAAGDESLTMTTVPSNLPPGTRDAVLAVTTPAAVPLDVSVPRASTGTAGTYATLTQVDDGNKAHLSFDIAFDAQIEGGRIPVFVSTAEGAAVGFVGSEPIAATQLTEQAPWDDTLGADEALLFSVSLSGVPSLVQTCVGDPSRTDVNLELLAADGLSTQDWTGTGRLWLVEPEDALLVARPSENPAGAPSTLSVASRTGGTTAMPEPDDLPSQALALPGDPCEHPFLGLGAVSGALDLDRLALGATSCPLKVAAVARSLADRPWSTPDLRIEVRGPDEETLASSTGWPSAADADPSVPLEISSTGRQIAVGAQMGTTGPYLVNVRRAETVRKVCRPADRPFIELEVAAHTVTSSLSVSVIDPSDGSLLSHLDVPAMSLPADGLLVLGRAAMPETDVDADALVGGLPETGPFAVVLFADGVAVDAVQAGESGSFGEGEPLPEAAVCAARLAGIDSGDNSFDFWVGWADEL
jgi:hypothetical protein